MMDQFLRSAKSQCKWYGLYSDHKADPSAVSSWNTDACKLNSCYSRVPRQSGLTSTQPTSRRISQERLRRWEKSAMEATVICNQAASFNRMMPLPRCSRIYRISSRLYALKVKVKAPPKCQLPLTNCSF